MLAALSLMLAGEFLLNKSESYSLVRDQQTSLQYEISVTLKLIQVWVINKSGKPVSDLSPEDFVVLDNGTPVKITEFERHGRLPSGAKAGSRNGSLTQSSDSTPPSGKMNRKFILFLDFAYNNQNGVVGSLKAASSFLNSLAKPGDEAALFSINLLQGLTVHEYLTADLRQVRAAVEALNAKQTAGRASEIEERYWLEFESQNQGSQSGRSARAPFGLESERQEAKTQAELYITRLVLLAKALRLVPGQKNVIFFSTGVPATMIFGCQAQNAFDVGDSRLRPLYEDMLKEFADSNCAFFVFDSREAAKVASLFAQEDYGVSGSIFSAQGVFRDDGVYRPDRTTGLDSLKRLSDRTGGRFYSNINFYEQNLAQVEEITRDYYVLGFQTNEPWDGRFHEIKVRVKRHGHEVRAQAGYFSPKPYNRFSDIEKKIQLYDLALNERSPFKTPMSFPIQALAYDADAGWRLQMLAAVPKEKLGLLAGKSVEFIALIFDVSGNLLSLQRTAGDITAQAGEDILFTAGAAVPRGRYRCRVVIRNLETGVAAVASVEVEAPKPAPGKVILFSPLLAVNGPQPAGLECRAPEGGDIHSWRDIYPYDATAYSPLLSNVSSTGDELLAYIPYSTGGLSPADIVISAYLIDETTGEKQRIDFTALASTRIGSVETQVLEFSLDHVPPGKYLLAFHAADSLGESEDNRQVSLIIHPEIK